MAFTFPLPPDSPSGLVARVLPSLILGPIAVVLSWKSVTHLGKHFRVHAGLYEDHELVRTGPYAIVRHPIYTPAGDASVLAPGADAVARCKPFRCRFSPSISYGIGLQFCRESVFSCSFSRSFFSAFSDGLIFKYRHPRPFRSS